jgi:hypothetical protein
VQFCTLLFSLANYFHFSGFLRTAGVAHGHSLPLPLFNSNE